MISHSPDETKKIATDLAATLQGGEVLFLEGELGAGKTTFVQGLAEALGARDAAVRSPTFTIMNEYRIPEAGSEKGIHRIVHMDFYRLGSSVGLGLEELLGRSDTVAVIEWPPQELRDEWQGRAVEIAFSFLSEAEREMVIQFPKK